MMWKRSLRMLAGLGLVAAAAQADPKLIATGTLEGGGDLSGLSGTLENGLPANILGGMGSGLAWAGGKLFVALPDRGPNATSYAAGTPVDNTTSYIPRVHKLELDLTPATSGSLPYTLTAALKGTTLLYSHSPLLYGATDGLPDGAPTINTASKHYFSGRSDNFSSGISTDSAFARLDPEGIRVSSNGRSIFVSDEYGPYVYRFALATGARTRTYALPDHFAINALSSLGAAEISGNASGRVANKGMEGLAITPDGSTLVGFEQSPLIQDGGDGGRVNRIVTIDVETGATHEYAYDNRIGTKNFNSSELVALNDHQFLVLERDGKGLGDGSSAVVKQIWAVDISAAEDVSALSGEATLLTKAPAKTLFLNIKTVLNANGFTDTQIPAKLEGLAFGSDVVVDGVSSHTLFLANDNDFVSGVAGPNRFFVFAITDADLAASGLSFVPQELIQHSDTWPSPTPSPTPAPRRQPLGTGR